MQSEIQIDRSIAYVIDDDEGLRDGIGTLLRSVDIAVETFGSTKEFLRSKRPDVPGCLILDVRLPGMSGLEFQSELGKLGIYIPVVFITAHADVPMGVQAMKAGAVEFLCKPFREQDLLDAVRTAINKDVEHRTKLLSLLAIQQHHETLTPREQEVMALVVSGMMNKQIAGKLGLSEITVKVHRASIMRKMNAKSLAELVRQADALDGAKTTS
jgi:FixJ family two-component response regulator